MDLSERSLKSLWGRAGGRCSFPTCRMELFVEEEVPSPTLIGENCHIVAEKDNGPRGDPEMPISERNLYGNLILLCRNHHKIIDDNANGVGNYPIAKLLEIKQQHEVWVKGQLGYDANKQFSDELWAGLIDDWQRLCHIDHWHGWSSYVLGSGQPRINSKLSDDLNEARLWLMTRCGQTTIQN